MIIYILYMKNLTHEVLGRNMENIDVVRLFFEGAYGFTPLNAFYFTLKYNLANNTTVL